MIVEIKHKCSDFDGYRSARVKSLFNAESGCNWEHIADLPIEDIDWKIGLIVGASGTGKTSIGSRIFEKPIHDLYSGWDSDKPIVECIDPQGDFNSVTGALSAVGLGDVPTWLRPFHVLSNGEKFRAGLARLVCESQTVDVAIAPLLTEILPAEKLFKPIFGTLIFHPSPLPYGRGARSIKYAYERKEPITAATWFWADEGIDSGDICEQEIIKINYDLTPREFYERDILPAMVRTLKRSMMEISAGYKRSIPQIERYSSYDKISK